MNLALSLFFLAAGLAGALAASGGQRQQPYHAIFNFGDSLSDVGNLVVENPKAFAVVGKLPYGETFFGRPTGRCSDGRLVVDFLAEAYGLPYMPAYLSLNVSKGEDGRRGANFAVAGATALGKDFFGKLGIVSLLWTNNSLADQIVWFKKLKPSLCATPKDCAAYMRKSLFLVGEIGANDYNYMGLTGASVQQLRDAVPRVIESVSNAVEALVGEGAEHVVVPSSVPFGCASVYLTFLQSDDKREYDRYGCLTAYNSLAIYHNQQLLAAVARLREAHPHARIMYADYYKITMRFVYAPAAFGQSR
uniref:GDSL esterase/lipase n=1 Tax=Kalanchoe fedtschenkoi TaxID=63787 RepID=A0A7N0U318_KALFE